MEPFWRVSNSEIGMSDFHDVWDALKLLSPQWKSIGLSLRLEPTTLDVIKASNGNDPERCLEEVIAKWLKKSYDYQRHGNPSWRKVCIAAVEGGDPVHAEKIATEHLHLPIIISNPSPTGLPQESAMSPGSSTKETSTEHLGSPANQIYVSSGYSQNQEKTTEVLRELNELQITFEDNLYETRKCFEPHQLSEVIDYIESHLQSLLGLKLKTQNDKQAVRDEFHDIKTIPELFAVLDKYVSWFNYEFILKLARVFLRGNRRLQRKWTAYTRKLKDYFINCGGLTKEDALQFGLSDIPCTKVMIAKVDRTDYTLADLFIFRSQISKFLQVPDMKFYFSSVNPGSLQLTYFIPDYLYSILFPLTNERLQFLANIEVSELTCEDTLYSTKEVIVPRELPSINIDINDILWHENTSTPLHDACWNGFQDEAQWLIYTFEYDTFQRGLYGWTPLLSASYGGHVNVLEFLINQYQCNPNEGDDDNVTCLHMASYKGHLNIVEYLIDTCHVYADVADNSNTTGLLYSAMGGHCSVVEFLLKKSCNSSHSNCHGASLSLLACKSGQLSLVLKLESLNLFSSQSTDYYGFSILHYSCMSDNVELVQYLLTRYQLLIDVKDHFGRTSLHIASWYASSAVVDYIVSIRGEEALLETDNQAYSSLQYVCDSTMFIEATGIIYNKLYVPCDSPFVQTFNSTILQTNINFLRRHERVNLLSSLLKKVNTFPNFNINSSTFDGQSLLHLASLSGSKLLVRTLEEYHINVASLDHFGCSVVHHAALSGSLSVLRYLNTKYTATEPDYFGQTPLHYACDSGGIDEVDYLMNNHDSSPNATSDNGMTSLHHSCRHGHIDLTEHLIEEHGADINLVDNEGLTVVHHGAWSGNLDLVECLINEQGLLPTAVDNTGYTPLYYATQTLRLPLVKKLVTTYGLDPDHADNHSVLPIHNGTTTSDINDLEYLIL